MDYIILESIDPSSIFSANRKLTKEVKNKIAQGYRPTGGVSTAIRTNKFGETKEVMVSQAMIKE